MYIRFTKYFFDLTTAVLFLLSAAPLMAMLMLILFVYNRGVVFFVQTRIGKDEKPFLIYKFKTMNDQLTQQGSLLSDEQRITKLGAVLRAFHLDELPNLINVLKGELSLVGPRPLLPEYLHNYNAIEKKRHLIKPGITGLAQIKGGNSLTWKDRFHWDIYYVKKRSFILDLQILLDTLKYLSKGNKILFSTSLLHLRKNSDNP